MCFEGPVREFYDQKYTDFLESPLRTKLLETQATVKSANEFHPNSIPSRLEA